LKIITTLAEDNYFLGFAALLNSIITNGTDVDKVIVGYRGELPGWLKSDLQFTSRGLKLQLNNRVTVEFIFLNGNFHMVHEKPNWLFYLITVLEPNADEFYFFDSDIVVMNRMSFFSEWVKHGLAVCEDVNSEMCSDHPIRMKWKEIANSNHISVKNVIHKYFNSGFLGWRKEANDFILDWKKSFELMSQKVSDLGRFRQLDRTYPVISANQDSLNLAIMITSTQISSFGTDAMGFTHGTMLMSHPIGIKPWDKNYFLDFFKGIPPRIGDIHFWQSLANGPLTPYSNIYLSYKIFECKFLRFMSRFYRRLNK